MNLWHDLSPGVNPPEKLTSVIEISAGSQNKFELDKDTGLLRLDRVLNGSVMYPTDYGFIPQTLAEDNDPLDILLLSTNPIPERTLVDCRPIGVLHMIDDGETDDKIVMVPYNDPRWVDIESLDQIPVGRKAEIQKFFLTYKLLEKKYEPWQELADQKVGGIGDVPTSFAQPGHKKTEVPGYLDATAAKKIIMECIERYKQKYGK